MKLSQEIKNYLNKEILKETASGYTYRMVNGKRQKSIVRKFPKIA